MLSALPDADVPIADKGDRCTARLREALTDLEITPCVPGRANRKMPIPYDADLYTQRSRIERMFGRLKEWRSIATGQDRCAHTFKSAICIAAAFFAKYGWFCRHCVGPDATVIVDLEMTTMRFDPDLSGASDSAVFARRLVDRGHGLRATRRSTGCESRSAS